MKFSPAKAMRRINKQFPYQWLCFEAGRVKRSYVLRREWNRLATEPFKWQRPA